MTCTAFDEKGWRAGKKVYTGRRGVNKRRKTEEPDGFRQISTQRGVYR